MTKVQLPLQGLVDSHCHLDRLDLESYQGDLAAALRAARSAGVEQMLCIAINLEDFPTVLAIAQSDKNIHASVGVHPLEPSAADATVDDLVALAKDAKVVAIGETGLDYHYSQPLTFYLKPNRHKE